MRRLLALAAFVTLAAPAAAAPTLRFDVPRSLPAGSRIDAVMEDRAYVVAPQSGPGPAVAQHVWELRADGTLRRMDEFEPLLAHGSDPIPAERGCSSARSTHVDAREGWIAVTLATEADCGSEGDAFTRRGPDVTWVARVDAAPRAFEGCGFQSLLAGGLAWAIPAPCDAPRPPGAPATALVEELATGARRSYASPTDRGIGDVQAAGPFLSLWLFGESAGDVDAEARVLDRTTGIERYAVRGHFFSPSFALRPDGVLVAALVPIGTAPGPPTACGSDAYVLRWYSPTNTAGTTIPVAPCLGGVDAAGDDVLLERRTITGSSPADRIGEPVLTDLGGDRVRILPDVPILRLEAPGRLRYSILGCLGRETAVVVQDEAELVRAPQGPPECTLALRSRTVHATRGGRVPVRFACPNGCVGTVRIRRAGRRTPIEIGRGARVRTRALRSLGFQFEAGRSGRLVLRLGRRERATLRAGRRLRLRVETRVIPAFRGTSTFRPVGSITVLPPGR